MVKPGEHGMLPGSHEERYGPQCRCGAEWDWWNDKCTRATTTEKGEN